MVDVIVFNNTIVTFLKMIIFYFLLGTAIRVKVNQVACGSLASTASDSER